MKKDNPDLAYAGDETHQTLLIPLSALITRNAQNVTTATAGGHLVHDDIASQIEHSLRAASVCARSGARVVANLRGDLTLGRETAEVAVDWVAELDEVSPADPTYGVVKLTPSRLVATTSLSSQLHAQTPDLSAFIVESLSRGIGAGLDKAALQGGGFAGEPLGLLNRASVQSVTFSGAATWAKMCSFEAKVSGANADDDNITWVAAPDVREKLKTVQRYSGSSTALWEGNLCADRPAHVTTGMLATRILCGDFSKVIFPMWGEGAPVQVIVDPHSSKKSGKVELLCALQASVAVRREEVFCISSDSAVQ